MDEGGKAFPNTVRFTGSVKPPAGGWPSRLELTTRLWRFPGIRL